LLAGLAPEDGAVVEGRRFEDRLEAVALLPDARVRPGRLLDLDAGPLAEKAQRLAEVEVVPLLDEREDVAPLAAPEAAPGPRLGEDVEGGGLLAVERAEALEAAAGPLQLDGLADDVDDVEAALDLVDGRVRHGHPRARCRPSRGVLLSSQA